MQPTSGLFVELLVLSPNFIGGYSGVIPLGYFFLKHKNI